MQRGAGALRRGEHVASLPDDHRRGVYDRGYRRTTGAAIRRRTRRPATSTVGARRATGRLAGVAILAVALAACGGEDADDIEGLAFDDAEEVEDADDADADDADADAADADDADAAGDDEGTADEADEADDGDAATDDDGGEDREMTTHSAPAEAEPDCAAIDQQEPGATIAFPSPDGDGWQDAGDSPVTVEVVGCSNTFEANVQYEAYHGQDASPTLDGFTMGGAMGNWEEFRFEETFWTPGEWRIVVFEYDAESGDRQDYDEQTFEIGDG